MKNTMALTVLCAASTAALGQDVQVYGILDAGVSRVSGLTGGTRTSLVSGIMEGSRLGFRGNEDLGGGYRALFTMESRVEADTGGVSVRPPSGSQVPDRLNTASLLGLPGALQPVVNGVAATIGSTVGTNVSGALWDRQIYVGLVTPFGAVLAGRQYTPAYEIAGAFDALGTQSSLSVGQVGTFPPTIDIRASNALAYRIQQGPISASLMVAAGEGSATTGRLYGAMGQYKASGFAFGVGYNSRENELGEKSLSTLVLGGSVDVGPGTGFLQVGRIKDDHPSGLSAIAATLTPVVGAATAGVVQNAFVQGLKQDSRSLHLGYRMTLGANTIYLAYNALNDRLPANADVTSFGVAYSYALSKRTDLNAVLTRFDNKNLAQTAPGQAGFVGGVTASAGTDSNNVAVGIRHRF